MIKLIIVFILVPVLIGLFVWEYIRDIKRSKRIRLDNKRDEDRRRQSIFDDENRRAAMQRQEELRIARLNIDIVIEKSSHNKYRVIVHRGDGSKEYLWYRNSIWDDPRIPEKLSSFYMSTGGLACHNSASIVDYPEEALPSIKRIVEHYLKHRTIDPVNIIMETFIVNRAQLPAADISELDKVPLHTKNTILELIPLLIEASEKGDHDAESEILNRLQSLKLLPAG